MTRADLLEEQRRIRRELLDHRKIEERKAAARKAETGAVEFNRQSWHRSAKTPDPRFTRGDRRP